ncbi:hypothetical protein AHMF7605_08115 [Adhaeribacter arboris]|uniref:Uncharacterized protein n=1 Tax=Adhaeribacter arboris TaxID=2072846 RepID=A0A2T2YD92_9BACT|nr:hypothetical protein [Adhaeribacter arboris]PSR53491.1 hypothetical protein AHMF7605_08115 [Adhaeribacter arboris]
MELQGTWTKDNEGFMEFSLSQLQRLYEAVTDAYHERYNQYLDELDDEEEAHYQALAEGYEMVNDYKTIDGQEEFATTYYTPTYVLDVWYELDPVTQKRIYDQGFIRISSKNNPEV